uniref:Abhydrolase_3 domain-containing protein n=1 Tax=Macrostomum lignano TaxID=282301 RepID=A0A1I8FMX1_9PLAT
MSLCAWACTSDAVEILRVRPGAHQLRQRRIERCNLCWHACRRPALVPQATLVVVERRLIWSLTAVWRPCLAPNFWDLPSVEVLVRIGRCGSYPVIFSYYSSGSLGGVVAPRWRSVVLLDARRADHAQREPGLLCLGLLATPFNLWREWAVDEATALMNRVAAWKRHIKTVPAFAGVHGRSYGVAPAAQFACGRCAQNAAQPAGPSSPAVTASPSACCSLEFNSALHLVYYGLLLWLSRTVQTQ